MKAYWIGVAFGLGVGAFFTALLIQWGVFPAWPDGPVVPLKYGGAALAVAASVAALYVRRPADRLPQ